MPRDANRDGEALCATVTRHRRDEDAGRERCLDRGGGGNPAALREGAVALCDAFALQTCFQRLTHKRQPRKPQTRSRRDARCSRVQTMERGKTGRGHGKGCHGVKGAKAGGSSGVTETLRATATSRPLSPAGPLPCLTAGSQPSAAATKAPVLAMTRDIAPTHAV